ncbi:MAG TPA: hypothetical protein PLJ60_20925 [Chryseolinea sp.]|nr:hypothetical protein [Chryseolinea sp.]HPM32809.1 hypothetical protein [Chryseolinea sp.]
MITCISGKKVFPSEQIAEDALIEAWGRNSYPAGSGPVAVYKCDDCGFYHFTSQGKMNGRLSSEINAGRIKLQQEVNYWERKLKK